MLGKGAEIELVETSSFLESVEQAGARTKRDSDIVVAVGGDGTANAVANGLLRVTDSVRPAMGLIPCGRGNDFAAVMGLTDREGACQALLAGCRRRVDVGKTDSGLFLGVAGAGFDSKVARRAQQPIPFLTGSAAYVYALLRTLTDLDAIQARVTYDSGVYEGLTTLVAVGNADRYGGGMRITPRASVEDGLLDVCVVKRVSRRTLLRVFPKVFRGGHLHHPAVFYTKSRKIAIESPEPVELFADGEFMQPLPATFHVLPAALEVVTPAGNRPSRSTQAEHSRRA